MQIPANEYIKEYVQELGENPYLETIGFIPLDNTGYDRITIGCPGFSDLNNIPLYLKLRRFEGEYITGVCRISITEPKYITGYNEDMILTEDHKNIMFDILSAMSIIPLKVLENGMYCKVPATNWDFVLYHFESTCASLGGDQKFYHIKDNYKMPDYRNL